MRHTAKLYLRLSKDEPGQTSLADQERECRKLAAQLNITNIEVYAEEPGTSGYKDVARPVFDNLLENLSSGDLVIAWALDRLTRRGMEQAGAILRRLEESGAHLVTVSDGIDTRIDAGSDINVGIRAIMAREYSKSLSKNSKRGKETAAASGKWPGGRRWFGYAVDNNGNWTGPKAIDDTEAKVLQEIRRRYVQGERLTSIAQDLNEQGIPTVDGVHWRAENMLELLRNPRYIGLNNIGVPGNWPPIFTALEREEVEALRTSDERMKNWPLSPFRSRTYLATGLVYCGVCDVRMRANGRHHRNGEPHRRYVCPKCSLGRSAEPVELLLTNGIFFRLDTPELGKLLTHPDVPNDNIHKLTSEIEGKSSALDRLIDAYQDGLLSKAQFTTRKTSLEAAIQAAESRLQREVGKRTGITLNAGETVREWWHNATIGMRRRLVVSLTEKVIIKPSNTNRLKKADYYRGHRFIPADVVIEWIDAGRNTTPMHVEDPALLTQEAALLR